MPTKSELHSLVHSLSPSEKRYFKLYAQRHSKSGDSNYWQLYQALLDMDAYEESRLRAGLKEATFLPQLAFYKNYLKKLLLQSLREFHRNRSKSMDFREQLDQIELLYERGMISWCQRLLRKLKKQAQEEEDLLTLLEVNRWEMNMLRTSQEKGFRESLEELDKEKERLLHHLLIEGKLRSLHDQFLGIVTRFISLRNESDRAWVEDLESSPLLLDATILPTRNSRIFFYYCKIYGHQLRGNYPEVIKWYGELDQLFQASRDLIEKDEDRYLKFLLGYLDAFIESGEYDQFQAAFPRIRDFAAGNPSSRATVFKSSVHLQIRFALNSGQFEAGDSLGELVHEGFREHDAFISSPTRLSFAYNLLIISLLGDNPKAALAWANFILDLPEKDLREDIRIATRVFELIIHFQLGNFDLINYRLRSSTRYLAGKDLSLTFEKMVFQAMRQLSNAAPEEHFRLLYQLKDELTDLGKRPGVQVPGLREVLFWLEKLTLKDNNR